VRFCTKGEQKRARIKNEGGRKERVIGEAEEILRKDKR